MTDSHHNLPKLRAIDPQPASQDGRQVLVLRDPLQIGDQVVAMPYELAPLLALCDGTRTDYQMRVALLTRYGLQVSAATIERFVEVCDEALLLENERSRAAQAEALSAYRAAPNRRPSLAGLSYPDDPQELAALFRSYAKDGLTPPPAAENGTLAPHTGIISPHIDYQRGGSVYAAVWDRAAPLVRGAELAIVFGTDHYGGANQLTLTRQSYATPFGTLPTPAPLVEAVARAIGGPEAAFAGELHHRSEHSIELAVNWLHYVRTCPALPGQGQGGFPGPLAYPRGQAGRPGQPALPGGPGGTPGGTSDLAPLPVLPILCGSFHEFVAGQGHPDQDPVIGALVQTLAEAARGLRVIVVAGADLAHVGPAFGGAPQGPGECSRVQAADRELIERMCARDARGFFDAVAAAGDCYNVCGLSPIYLTLRTLAALSGAAARSAPSARSTGQQVAYDTCPADQAGTSFVSICGVIVE